MSQTDLPIADEMDNQYSSSSKRRRLDKDADLQGRPLAEILLLLRNAATYYITEIDSIPLLTTRSDFLYRDYDLENNALYIFNKIQNTVEGDQERIANREAHIEYLIQQTEKRQALRDRNAPVADFEALDAEEKKLSKRRPYNPLFDDNADRPQPAKWTEEDTKFIEPLQRHLKGEPFGAEGVQYAEHFVKYVGNKYHVPFSPRWNKSEIDDIKLMESISGASLNSMNDIMRNYSDYTWFLENNAKWRALLLHIIADETRSRSSEQLSQNPLLTLLTFDTVRSHAQRVLHVVTNVENKMSELYNLVTNSDITAETARKQAEKIAEIYNRNDALQNEGGRNGIDAYGGLECATINNNTGLELQREQSQRDYDQLLADAFGKKPTYEGRMRSLKTYLEQNARFAFKTSVLPLYIEKPFIEFTDKWKGVLRGSMGRYSDNPKYRGVIETYRDILLVANNEPTIAIFSEFIAKRSDNTQAVMRPNQNAYSITHYQLHSNQVQYKAIEQKLDELIARSIGEIRKQKKKRL